MGKFEPRIMIVESNINQRKMLLEAVLALGLTSDVYEASSVAEGQELLLDEDYQLCFVGAGISETTQKTFIATMTKEHRLDKCIFIPLCKHPSKEKVYEFIHAGANGVLVVPVAEEAIKRVIELAYKNKINGNKGTRPKADDGETLITLTSRLAERLALISKALQTQNIDIHASTLSAKFIQDLLLQCLKTINDKPEEAIDTVVKKIFQQL